MKRLFPFLLILLTGLAIHAQTPIGCREVRINIPDPLAEIGIESAVIAEVTGGDEENLKYEWLLHELDLVSGQGTKRVVVKRRDMGGGTATVFVSGLPNGCKNSATDSFIIVDYNDPILVDRFGKLSIGGIKARIDNYCFELDREPASIGYIHIGSDARARSQSREILKYLDFAKKAALSRISFVFTADKGVATKLWVVPKVQNSPFFKDPVYIKASDNLALRKFLASKSRTKRK